MAIAPLPERADKQEPAALAQAGPVGWQLPGGQAVGPPVAAVVTDAMVAARRRRFRATKWILGAVAIGGLAMLASQGSFGGASIPGVGSSSVVVTYRVTGTASAASITFTDGSGNIQQLTNATIPLQSKSGVEQGIPITSRHGAFVSVLAQNTGASGNLSCSIEADGVVINTGHASGGYAITQCSATVP